MDWKTLYLRYLNTYNVLFSGKILVQQSFFSGICDLESSDGIVNFSPYFFNLLFTNVYFTIVKLTLANCQTIVNFLMLTRVI